MVLRCSISRKLCEKALLLGSRQASKEELDAHEIDECFSCAGEAFIILAHAAVSAYPGNGPLHNP